MAGSTFFNPPFSVKEPKYNALALGVISTNTRAFTAQGPIATLSDVLLFPTPLLPPNAYVGMWTVGNRRTYVSGVAVIGQSSTGIAVTIHVVPPSAPSVEGAIIPTIGDPRVQTR